MGSERTEKRPSSPTPLPTAPSATDGGERGEGQEIEIRYDPRKRFLSTLKAQLGENRALVTCRVTDYAAIGDQAALEGAVTLQKLTDAQLRDYLKDLPRLLEAVETDDALREIARTPLLLSFFAFAFRDRGDDLKALEDLREGALRDAIFNAYMDKRYAHEERRLKRLGQTPPFVLQEIKEALGRVAMENAGGMYRRGMIGTKYRHVDNVLERSDFELIAETKQVESFIESCVSLEYLQRRNDGHFSFIHLLLRDTLVYSFALPRLRDESLYTWFSEPSPPVALGAIKDQRIFELLGELAEDRNNSVLLRLCAMDGLGQSEYPRAIEIFIRLLDDPDRDVRWTAASHLGNTRDIQAISPLIQLLRDPSQSVRQEASQALKRIGTSDALAAVRAWKSRQSR